MKKNKSEDLRVGERNKLKILQAAEQQFVLHGFKGASVQQIADAAELPKTNVLYYFKTKQDLYLAVLKRTMKLWNSRFDQATVDDDPAEVLAEYIAEKMEISRTYPLSSKIFAMEIINGAPNLDDYFDQEHAEWMQQRLALINGWAAKGKINPVDADYLLYQIWASTQHYADFSTQIQRLRGEKMHKKDFQRATNQIIQVILTGIGLTVPAKYQGA